MNNLEIMFADLNEEGQKKVLEFLDIQNPEDANLDVFPVSIITKPEL